MRTALKPQTGSSRPSISLIALLLPLLALYIGLRFDWRWLEGDSTILTGISRSLYETSILTDPDTAYNYGFTYPAFNAFLANLTGLSISQLQRFIQPFLVVLLVPMAHLAFSSLTGDRHTAFLATLILFLQPEFLFEAVRSSHAKVTYLMALSMVFILAASLRSRWGARTMIKWVLLFYAAAFAMICSNSFFASNYIFSLALAFLGARVLKWLRRGGAHDTSKLHRLLFITLACGILVFLFMFYLYPPAMEQFSELPTIFDRVAALLFDVEAEAANPYGYVGATWTSSGVYLALTLMNWVVLGISFLGWLGLTRQLLRRQELGSSQLLLWLCYAAFALLLAVSVLFDLAGVLQSNLQVRVFPNFMVFAIPLASLAVVSFLDRLQARPGTPRKAAAAVLVVVLVYFAGASLFKTTNEPLLSNNWGYFTPGESQVLAWLGEHPIENIIWSGYDRRLEFLSLSMPASEQPYLYRLSLAELAQYRAYVPYFLVSELAVQQSARIGRAMPDLRQDTFRVYDNGQAVIYKDRPVTRYQK